VNALTDRILNIGESAIEASDERVKSMMNNMVNAQTPGFKRTDVIQVSFPAALSDAERKLGSMRPQVISPYYDHAGGAMIRTGVPTDLAIGGDGFFVIQCPWGDGFTRDGRFVVNREGQLVTVSGNNLVLGGRGAITVPAGSSIEITNTGQVKIDDVIVDEIQVVRIDDKNSLEAVSGSVFRLIKPDTAIEQVQSPVVISGFIESSNVSTVDEMMNLVMLSQLYTIDTKIIQVRDANLASANEMGKLQ
jgi:flagellar basal-body rod protein FlgF